MKQIQKSKIDWRQFLSGVPARDYVFQDTPYEEQIQQAAVLLEEAELVLVGAGARASASAGLTYSGSRFTDNFREFIDKYGSKYMTDMYAAGFYPFPTEEAKWGYWSKHSMLNRVLPPALPLYKQLYEIVKEKNYFVEDENWHEAAGRYGDFLKKMEKEKCVLLELGVGFNTPTIIRFPFEKMMRDNSRLSLIRLNLNEAVVPESFGTRAIGIGGDMAKAISDLYGQLAGRGDA